MAIARFRRLRTSTPAHRILADAPGEDEQVCRGDLLISGLLRLILAEHQGSLARFETQTLRLHPLTYGLVSHSLDRSEHR